MRRLLSVACVLSFTAACNDASLVNTLAAGCADAGETAEAISLAPASPMKGAPRRENIPVLAPPPASFAPSSADDLIRAMGREPDDDSSAVLLGSPLASAAFAGLGELEPSEGNSFVWLSTGVAGAGTHQAVGESIDGTQDGTSFGLGGCDGPETFDCVQLRYSFLVPEGAHSVRFDFNFLSTEYPEYVGQGYNDSFTVSLESPSHNFDNISFDENGNSIGIDSAFFNDTCADMTGSGFDLDDGFGGCDAGATGRLGTIAPVEPGELVTLTFALMDSGDGIYDSAVSIDNLQTTSNEIETPETNDCE